MSHYALIENDTVVTVIVLTPSIDEGAVKEDAPLAAVLFVTTY